MSLFQKNSSEKRLIKRLAQKSVDDGILFDRDHLIPSAEGVRYWNSELPLPGFRSTVEVEPLIINRQNDLDLLSPTQL